MQPVADIVPQALTLGDTVSGTIGAPWEMGLYTFTLAARTQLYFDALTNNYNINWSLQGPRGPVVSNRTFFFSDYRVPLSDLKLPAGDYELTIEGVGETISDYQFRLFDLATASIITPGTPKSDSLSVPNETIAYQFTASR